MTAGPEATMSNAHQIASGFDRGGMALAGVAASCIQDAWARQAAVDEEQAYRNVSAGQRAVRAAVRQRAELQAAVDENASLRAEVARLQSALAASQAQTATAQAATASAQRETVRIKGLLRGAVGLKAA
jgi:hypothetical protein